ncbi:MAG TPA: cell division protein FtsQ/DivIB [Lacibacter sp.]|nr:cell division protein FtsQ/DivIB [Lacibacter sp.]HMO87814.1 cell division protein FtsQ/DivIB [Lacibacter sp.]HMP87879.1 cell division protein FtsQ/DivIB [Lacibacter sp.]
MHNNNIWRKVLLATVWLVVAAGTVVLLIAATRQQNGQACQGVEVRIRTNADMAYLKKNDILRTMAGDRPDLLQGALIKTFDLEQLEQILEQNLWVRNAELFFDNAGVLHVEIEEREPVARVFSESGETFYVDERCVMLPVNGKQVARVPVFTGFPPVTYPLGANDSLLLTQVRDMGRYMLKHPLWMAQIDQLQLQNREMELVPKLGQHIILFGSGTQVEQKFRRLDLFYRQVLKQAGWNAYSLIDLRFDRQLVATRRDSAAMAKAFVLPADYPYNKPVPPAGEVDSAATPVNSTKPETVAPDSKPKPLMVQEKPKPVTAVPATTPTKQTAAPKPAAVKEPSPPTESRQESLPKTPKAVMPKKDTTR